MSRNPDLTLFIHTHFVLSSEDLIDTPYLI